MGGGGFLRIFSDFFSVSPLFARLVTSVDAKVKRLRKGTRDANCLETLKTPIDMYLCIHTKHTHTHTHALLCFCLCVGCVLVYICIHLCIHRHRFFLSSPGKR